MELGSRLLRLPELLLLGLAERLLGLELLLGLLELLGLLALEVLKKASLMLV